MSAVYFKNVSKYFDDNVAVKNLNLDVREGEFISLLGPSGCGKTTILRMLSGLEQIDQGSVLFNSQDMAMTPTEHRNVGMVFQHFALFPHMTVEQNITFGLRMRGIEKSEIAERLNDIIQIVQLETEQFRYPSQLSGGQMQRVALARTLITKPGILLMDEPFANLDASLRVEMRKFVADLQKKLKITTILVTHDQQEALELSDRVAVVFDGQLAQFDTPKNIFNHPLTQQVALFMGSTNILPAEYLSAGKYKSSIGTIQIGAELGSSTVSKSRDSNNSWFLSIRPENVLLELSIASDSDVNWFSGKIIAIQYVGVLTKVDVLVKETVITSFLFNPELIAIGIKVRICLPVEKIWPMAATNS